MAVTAHGHPRLTLDVDILLAPAGLNKFREQLVGRGYIAAFPGATKTFIDAGSKVKIERKVGRQCANGVSPPVGSGAENKRIPCASTCLKNFL